MKIFYCGRTGGFYCEVDNAGRIPADVVEVSAAERHAALVAEANGKVIRPDANGSPVAVDPPPPSDEFMATQVRAQRDARLTACDWTQQPDVQHPEPLAAAWRTYRQALRDITAQQGFPQNVTWPVAPGSE